MPAVRGGVVLRLAGDAAAVVAVGCRLVKRLSGITRINTADRVWQFAEVLCDT